MGRVKYFLSSKELMLLYNSIVLSHLNYCAMVWGTNYPTNVLAIHKLQKRALRIVDKKPFIFPSNELFIKYKVLKFPDIVLNLHIVVLLAFLNGTLPDAISSLFQLSRPLNTRGSNHFSVPFTYNVYRIFALPYAAPRTWNKIITTMHRDIEEVPRNKFTLKKHLKTYFIDKYEND